MWGTSGVELLRFIDSQLAWNTDLKGRHRAPRRPRASFSKSKQKDRVKHITKSDSLEDLKDANMPVSESEKLGVNILGHRFDGSLEGVPIKKRLLLAHSPSSSRGSPSNVSEVSYCLLESPGPHHINKKLEPHRLSSSTFGDGVDFSGISILATAACSSPLSGCDIMNSGVSVFKDENHDNIQNFMKSAVSHEEVPSDVSVLDGKADISAVSVAVQSVSAVEDGSCETDLCMSSDNASCSDNTWFEGDNKNYCIANTFKFHWDLNKEMDAWEVPDHEDCGFVERSASEGVCGHNPDVSEVCLGSVGHSMGCILPITCHSLSQTVYVSHDIHVASNLTKSLTRTEHVMNISMKAHCADEQADNPGSSSDNPCTTFSSAGQTDASHKALLCTIDVQSASNQLAITTQDDIQDPTGDSHDSTMNVTLRKSSTQRSPNDEAFESTVIAFPSCRSASSKNTDICADDCNNNREIETAESDFYHGCHSVEDAESSDSSKERHGSPEQVDCNAGTINMDSHNHKEMESCNEPSRASSVSRTGSHVPCKSFSNAVVKVQGEICPDIHPVGDCNFVASAIAAEPEVGMEKLEQNGDNDSQYEDGELRDSILHDWEIDGDEECEDEHVDYGSDEREHYMYEDALDSPACRISPEKNNLELDSMSDKCNIPLSGQVSRESLETRPQPNCQSTEVACGEIPRHCDDIVVRHAGCISKGDDYYKQSNHPAFLKMSLSGYEVVADSAKGSCKENISKILDMVKAGTPFKKLPDSKNSRGLLNCGRVRFSGFSCSKDGTCQHVNRDDGDSNHTGKVDHGHVVSLRKVGSFNLQEDRSKGYPGEEPLKHWISSQQERHIYYSGYVKPAPKNAAEAAAAKVESNGFAVAPDGTVVEPSHLECAGWSSRRNSTTAAQATYRSFPRRVSTGRDRIPQFKRDDVLSFNGQSKLRVSRKTSPDRRLNDDEGSFRHGIWMLSSGRKEKYGLQISGDRINSSLRRHRTISQRNGSPSQRDLSLPQRCGRSRSRSRTLSPNAWTSPMRNDGGRAVDDRGYRHRDMSPDFRADDRGELVKVPYRHVNYRDRLSDFGPSFRNCPSLPSIPFHKRKYLDNLGGREFRIHRSSLERIPPERSFSRNHRFNVSYPGRMNQDEFFREMRRRHHDFAGAGKRSRYDMDNDGRGQ